MTYDCVSIRLKASFGLDRAIQQGRRDGACGLPGGAIELRFHHGAILQEAVAAGVAGFDRLNMAVFSDKPLALDRALSKGRDEAVDRKNGRRRLEDPREPNEILIVEQVAAFAQKNIALRNVVDRRSWELRLGEFMEAVHIQNPRIGKAGKRRQDDVILRGRRIGAWRIDDLGKIRGFEPGSEFALGFHLRRDEFPPRQARFEKFGFKRSVRIEVDHFVVEPPAKAAGNLLALRVERFSPLAHGIGMMRILPLDRRRQGDELLVRLDQFDTFEKEGRTSYAFRLVFQSPERTLTDGEVVVRMDAISAALREAGYEVR